MKWFWWVTFWLLIVHLWLAGITDWKWPQVFVIVQLFLVLVAGIYAEWMRAPK